MADHQIVGYVPDEEADRFGHYASALSLDVSAVATLLIVREISACRLRGLVEQYPAIGGSGRKIVAHQRNGLLKQAFAGHAAKFDVKSTPAAGSVFRAELHERWLEKAVHNR